MGASLSLRGDGTGQSVVGGRPVNICVTGNRSRVTPLLHGYPIHDSVNSLFETAAYCYYQSSKTFGLRACFWSQHMLL